MSNKYLDYVNKLKRKAKQMDRPIMVIEDGRVVEDDDTKDFIEILERKMKGGDDN